MVKTQVQLSEEQVASLRRMAAQEGVSMSELVRRAVVQLLSAQRSPSRKELWERAKAVFGKYDSGLTDVAQRHDHYLAEAYASYKRPGSSMGRSKRRARR